MEVLCSFTTKEVKDAEAGELLAFPATRGGADVGFVVKHADGGRSNVVMLRSDRESAGKPFHTSMPSDVRCTSFGSEWVFELVHPPAGEAYPTTDERYQPGVCLVKGSHVLLQVARDPSSIMSSEAYINMREIGFAEQPTGNIVGVKQWQIWLRPTDMQDTRKQPFLKFGL